jgi:hypothetical protein
MKKKLVMWWSMIILQVDEDVCNVASQPEVEE